jgi:hypothetical protein
MFQPSDNPVKIDAALEQKIKDAPSSEVIAQLLKDAYVAQNLAQGDPFDATFLTPTALAENFPQPKRFARKVDGQIFEGNSELEVERAIADYMRTKIAQPETRTEVARDDKGRFTAEQGPENAVAKAELELRFKRGDISTEEYLTQSGAIENYLAQQGIPLSDLKATVAEKQEVKMYEQSWAQATEQFLNGAGSDWPGGPELMREAGERMQSMGLTDAADKTAALAQVWNSMKAEAQGLRKISEANSPEEIRDAAVALRGGDSSIWGR